jgi:hypothetical protein
MLVQEVNTRIPPAEVIPRAKDFFTTRFTAYTSSETESDGQHIRLSVEEGEVMIGVMEKDGQTLVRGSSSRLHHEIGQFLATLAPAEEVRDNAIGPGVSGAG